MTGPDTSPATESTYSIPAELFAQTRNVRAFSRTPITHAFREANCSEKRMFNVIHSDATSSNSVEDMIKHSPSEFNFSNQCFTLGSPNSTASVSLSPVTVSTLTIPNFSCSYEFPLDAKTYTVGKLLEELVDTERIYVSSLHHLKTEYIQPLLSTHELQIASPVLLVSEYLELLSDSHQNFLNRLEKLFFAKLNHTPEECDLEADKVSMIELADRMAALVAHNAILPYIYEQYCLLNDQVLRLMQNSLIQFNFHNNCETFKLASEIFTESVQSKAQHLDYSFISLFQKPIARIPKYKLILEALVRHLPIKEENPFLQNSINASLAAVKNQLAEINENIRKQQIANRRYQKLIEALNSSWLNREIIANHFDEEEIANCFSFESLGFPILCDCLAVATMSPKNEIVCNYYCCILFKSCLVILEDRHTIGDIRFLIPLASCGLNGEPEGIFSNDPSSFKITYEARFQIFELIFFTSNAIERNTWECDLDILINHVNGPYNFDYSLSNNKQLFMAPNDICPADVCVEVFDNGKAYRNNFNGCYFRNLRVLKFNEKADSEQHQTLGDILSLKVRDRIHLERKINDLLSKDLSPVFHLKIFDKASPDTTVPRCEESVTKRSTLMRKASMALGGFFSRTGSINKWLADK